MSCSNDTFSTLPVGTICRLLVKYGLPSRTETYSLSHWPSAKALVVSFNHRRSSRCFGDVLDDQSVVIIIIDVRKRMTSVSGNPSKASGKDLSDVSKPKKMLNGLFPCKYDLSHASAEHTPFT